MAPIRLVIVRQKYRLDGGGERFIARFLTALNNSGIELNIIAREWSSKPLTNWNVHICNPPSNGRTTRDRRFANAARQYWKKHNFDLVQSHERISGCDIFRAGDGVHRAWLLNRFRIIPVYQRWLNQISNYHQYMINAENDVFQSPQLKRIICNSKMVRDEIMRYYHVSKEKCVLIYNAIDQNEFAPANSIQRRAAREALTIPEKSCVLIFVGSCFARKGLKQVLNAIASTDRYLIVVGKDKNQHNYTNLAKSLGCLSRVRFVGIRQDMLSCYHASDALILPTLYDPFPNALLEAMSCGLAVITSKNCGGAEFIEQGREGFVCDALDIDSLKMFISEISSRDKNPTMGDSARRRVSSYTFENLAYQFTSLYQQLLSL